MKYFDEEDAITEYEKQLQKKDNEIERIKEDYMILQNASDEVEETKDEEIERLNKALDTATEIINNKHKEIVILNNIINELEEYFIEKDTNGFEKCYIEDILYKIKELKEKE